MRTSVGYKGSRNCEVIAATIAFISHPINELNRFLGPSDINTLAHCGGASFHASIVHTTSVYVNGLHVLAHRRAQTIQDGCAAGCAQRRDSGMKGVMTEMLDELTVTHEDVRYVRTTVNMLVRNDAAQDAAINIPTARVTRLEKKVGLTS
jgi:hypothetical protein